MKIFHERIGPKAYDHINWYLRILPPQPRNAFNTLKETYDLSHGGADNSIKIVRINGCACMSPVAPSNYRNIITLFINNINDGMKKFNLPDGLHWQDDTLVAQYFIVQRARIGFDLLNFRSFPINDNVTKNEQNEYWLNWRVRDTII